MAYPGIGHQTYLPGLRKIYSPTGYAPHAPPYLRPPVFECWRGHALCSETVLASIDYRKIDLYACGREEAEGVGKE